MKRLGLLSFLVIATSLHAEVSTVSLFKSVKESDKPAEFLYTHPSGKEGTEIINATLSARTFLSFLSAPRQGRDTFAFASLSEAKDTLPSKKADTRALTAGLASYIELEQEYDTKIVLRPSVSAEREHYTRSHSYLYMVQADATTRWIHCPKLEGSIRIQCDVFPKLGFYRRDVRSAKTSDPTGRYGGPFVYAKATLGIGQIVGHKWLRRFNLETIAQAAKRTNTTGSYSKGTDRFYEGTVEYLLYDEPKSAWKPSIGITRTVGADPVNNQPRKVQTLISLRLGYGI